MNYLEILNLTFSILFTAYGVLMVHFLVFAIVGIFKYKKFPKTEKINKYGVIIPARNEELVVGNLIESIQLADYPQDQLQIFVIAHNCTDKTAEIARKYKNVVVYEYSNPNECTMGYAFKYLFAQIEKDYGTGNYDGFFLFNADNIVSHDFFSKMNDAFEYYHHESIITSYRNSKNFGTNSISGLCSVYFAIGCVIESRARTVLNCSTRIQGTGYVIPSSVVKDGNWPYVTITEDWEFTADQILLNKKIYYCDEAVYFDEQPTSFRIMWRQRLRWSRGHLLVCTTRLKDLCKALFSRKTEHRMSTYDILSNILPFCLILTFLTILQFLLTFFCPLAGISLKDAFLGYNNDVSWIMNVIMPQGYLYGFLRSLFIWYFGNAAICLLAFFISRKKIKNVSIFKKIWFILISPFYFFLQFFIDLQALFSKNLKWKTIPHDDKNNINTLS